MKTEHVLQCMDRLMDAERLLRERRLEEAAVIVTSVRAEFGNVDDLTEPTSMVLVLLDRMEKRLDDADASAFASQFPLTVETDQSTCRVCGASHNGAQFMALGLPANGEGVWKLGFATLAVRQCATCDNTLVRRTA